jgi:CheY-like chemotaxis protein
VVTAAGGLEGLKLAKELRPIAITLDVMMPDLDGWSVLAALRQDPAPHRSVSGLYIRHHKPIGTSGTRLRS